MTTTPTPPLALPALPEPRIDIIGDSDEVYGPATYYSADQMNAHATAAILSDRAGRGDAAGCDQALKMLRYFDKHLGTVLQEHQFNVPGGGSLAAHNVRLGMIELHKLLASLPSAPTGKAP